MTGFGSLTIQLFGEHPHVALPQAAFTGQSSARPLNLSTSCLLDTHHDFFTLLTHTAAPLLA